MAIHLVTNTHKRTPIGLPDRTMIYPGKTVETSRWEDFSQRKNLAWYVGQGILVAVEKGQQEQQVQQAQSSTVSPEDEKAALLTQLRLRGIDAGGNSKVETLREKLAAAIAKEQA